MTDTAPAPDLYEDDFYAWCMRQAAALRRRERGVNGLDYDNLAEELRGLAKTDFRSCQSFVTLIIQHVIKLTLAPESRDAPHWRGEIDTFRDQLLDDLLTETLLPRVKRRLPKLRAKAIRQLELRDALIDKQAARRIADELTWEQIIDQDWWPERPASD
jgi:hypothetical protein